MRSARLPDADGDAFDVVGHGEQIEGSKGGEPVAVGHERREVAGQCGRVTGDVGDPAGALTTDGRDDDAPSSGPRRVENHKVETTLGGAAAYEAVDPLPDRPDLREVGKIRSKVIRAVPTGLDGKDGTCLPDPVGEHAGEEANAGVQVPTTLPWQR